MDAYSGWHALTGEHGQVPKEEEMEPKHCTRCGEKRGDGWEHGSAFCGGTIFLTSCSRIHDAISGTSDGKINSPFYVDSGFQSGEFRWGKNGDAQLCWNCNQELLRHIGRFFLDTTSPAPILDGQPRVNGKLFTNRTTERRALARDAYMAALGGQAARSDYKSEPIPQLYITAYAEKCAIETVRRWDAFMAAVDAEGGE